MQDEVSEAKREHEVKTIGTHGGLFHCDEVLACYMLKVLPEYKDARYTVMCYIIHSSVSFLCIFLYLHLCFSIALLY